MYLRLRRDTDVQLVDTEEKLRSCSKLAESAYACAIDAEWQPNAQKPSATLVQLALKYSGGRTAVLLLDLLALPVTLSRPFLQGLFRNRTILKVGYGLFQDLKAVSTAIGSHGSGCIAVVHPFVDLRILSKQLWRKYPTQAPRVAGSGLAGLVNDVFGMQLDKQLQCSSWGMRPLSSPQLQYAALDAACLLGILQALASLCLRKEEVSLGLSSTAAEIGSREMEGEGICSYKREAIGGVLDTPESRGVEETTELLGQLTVSQRSTAEELTKGTSIAARDVWGCRLETSGGVSQVIRLRDNRLLPALHDDGEAHQTQGSSRLPPSVPWAQGEDNGLEPRFVADVPQEGLARQLRLCGFDATVAPNLSKGKRHLVYRFLVETAEREARVILTCDRLFVRRRLSDQTFLVQGLDKKDQLADVLAAFDLKVVSSDLLSRCAKCNGSFIPRPMTYVELSEAGKRQVPPTVVQEHDAKFWVCADCQQVYWRGSQFKRCLGHLSARLQVGPALTFA